MECKRISWNRTNEKQMSISKETFKKKLECLQGKSGENFGFGKNRPKKFFSFIIFFRQRRHNIFIPRDYFLLSFNWILYSVSSHFLFFTNNRIIEHAHNAYKFYFKNETDKREFNKKKIQKKHSFHNKSWYIWIRLVSKTGDVFPKFLKKNW